MNLSMSFWRKQRNIPGTNYTLTGHSRAAEKTGFRIIELDIALDAGIASYQDIKWVFLTHTHMDHAHGCSQFCVDKKDIIFYTPIESSDYLCNYINSGLQMNNHRRSSSFNKCFEVIGISSNDKITINKDRNTDIIIDIIKCDHSIPTVGFCFSESRSKLKSEVQ